MRDYRRLIVWETAHRFTLEVYSLTRKFPREEIYGLTSQVRRSCSSIAANIAEGCGRNGNAEFAQFLQFAMGSANETDYHLLLAKDLGLLTEVEYEPLFKTSYQLRSMLAALVRKVRTLPRHPISPA